jgi:hypothetical protein
MANAMALIGAITLTSAQSTIIFSNLPQTYRDLMLVITGAVNTSSADILINFNGDAGSNYSWVSAGGSGTTAFSFTNSGQTYINIGQNAQVQTGSTNYLATFNVMDFSATDKQKICITRANATGNGVAAFASRWASTSAVTSLVITLTGGNSWIASSTFYLYGIAG